MAGPAQTKAAITVLPIEEVTLPADDVSDLRDVFDAINRLCDTMKNTFEDETYEDCSAEIIDTQRIECTSSETELIGPEQVLVRKVEILHAERWSEVTSSSDDVDPVTSPKDDVEAVTSPRDGVEAMTSVRDDVEAITSPRDDVDMSEPAAPQEPVSEMYYTASSEVSLLSDMELPERLHEEESTEDSGRKECVIAGHVAAMRERFESMTRANTPCPDLASSTSPSIDVFRNITPSPDFLA